MGTRFVATREAPVHENVKQALVAASELDTRLVMRPLRNTERVLRNAAVDRILEKESRLGAGIRFDDIAEEVAGVYPRIMKEGALDAGAWSCGLVVGLIRDIPTVEGTRRAHRERGDGDHPQPPGTYRGLIRIGDTGCRRRDAGEDSCGMWLARANRATAAMTESVRLVAAVSM